MPAGEPPAPVASTAAATPAPNYAAPEPQQDIYAQAGYAPTQQPAPTQEQMYAPAQTYAQQSVVAPKEDPFASLMATPQPAVAQAPAAAPVQSGPPLPATGLPEGWTMEQWNHYGAQYLTAQQGQMAVAQPTTTNTTPAPAQTDLSGLLDDFDL